jgi:signal transduction histidine kinase
VNKRLIVILAVAIGICTLALIGVQIKWIYAMMKAEEGFFPDNVQLALQQVADNINTRETWMLSGDQPARSFQSGATAADAAHSNPIEKRISKSQLDSALQRELRMQGIFISFEYAVTDELGKIIFATTGFANALPDDTYTVALFPDDPDDTEHYYLSVYLPRRFAHVVHSLRWMFIMSILVTFIITSTFAGTLIIVFKQKRLSQIKTDFVNNITHELKTPISTISLAAEMLQDPAAPGNRHDVLRLARMIGSESDRLLLLVEQVLQSAIFEQGKLKLAAAETDMHEIIRQVLAQFVLQFDTLHITAECRLNAANPLVMGDEVHLANVVSNLVDNAIKYRKETEPLHIIIQTLNKHNRITVSLTDNGIGIDNRTAKQLFGQFYRSSGAENNYRVKGFGLGLYYVKNIIETHNGHFFASGNPGEGSTFGFELPVSGKVKVGMQP